MITIEECRFCGASIISGSPCPSCNEANYQDNLPPRLDRLYRKQKRDRDKTIEEAINEALPGFFILGSIGVGIGSLLYLTGDMEYLFQLTALVISVLSPLITMSIFIAIMLAWLGAKDE